MENSTGCDIMDRKWVAFFAAGGITQPQPPIKRRYPLVVNPTYVFLYTGCKLEKPKRFQSIIGSSSVRPRVKATIHDWNLVTYRDGATRLRAEKDGRHPAFAYEIYNDDEIDRIEEALGEYWGLDHCEIELNDGQKVKAFTFSQL